MSGINAKLAWRQFSKHRLFSFLNLTGLSTGMACVFLIFLWIRDEKMMDAFQVNGQRLYSVLQNIPGGNEGLVSIRNTPDPLGEAIKKEIPGIEEAVTLKAPDPDDVPTGLITANEKSFRGREMYVSNNFFSVFSFQLKKGNARQPFSGINQVLISEALAQKLFGGSSNAIGKSVRWDRGTENPGNANGPYLVNGVFQSPGANSSMQFDLLFSHEAYVANNSKYINWESSNPETYLLLKPGTDAAAVGKQLKNFLRLKSPPGPEAGKEEGTLFIQRFTDGYLYNQYRDGKVSGGRIAYVRLFALIAIFVIVIACINFTNLSTAKAGGRLREVGVRKVMGVNRRALIGQYLLESLLMVLAALVVAVLLVYLLLPAFRNITGKVLHPGFDKDLVIGCLGMIAVTSLLAGSYPAFYLSGFKPVAVLKGKWQPGSGQNRFRQALVIFQFSVSVVLIVVVMVVYKQMSLIQSVNLGYNKDNVIRIASEGQLQSRQQTFLAELRNLPGVAGASDMEGDMFVSHSGGGGIDWPGKTHRIGFGGFYADYGFMQTMGMQMAEGRMFDPAFPTDSNGVVFNETAIAAMQLKDPIGKQVKLWGTPATIIGVVKDFHYESMYNRIEPFFISFRAHGPSIVARIKAGSEKRTLSAMETLYKKFNPGYSFEFHFLNSDYEALYASEQRVSVLSRYFAGIAVLISCLGLFGLAAFTAQKRQKEIGIRKVIGASPKNISVMLSRDFLKLVLISLCVSLPLSWWLTNNWLDKFAYRTTLNAGLLGVAALAAVLIAVFSVGILAVRASRMNPVKSLRNE